MATLAERIAAARAPRARGPAPLAALSADPVARRRIQAEVERLAFDALGRTDPSAPETPAEFAERATGTLSGLAEAGVPPELIQQAARSMERLGSPLLSERARATRAQQRQAAEQALAGAAEARAGVFADLALAAARGDTAARAALAEEWLDTVARQPGGSAWLDELAARTRAMVNLRQQEAEHARHRAAAERLETQRHRELTAQWLASQEHALEEVASNPDMDDAFRADALQQQVLDLYNPSAGGRLAALTDPAAFMRLRRRAMLLAQRAAAQANANTRRQFSAELRDTMADRQAEAIQAAQDAVMLRGAVTRPIAPPEP
jgi:hypothetical protein